MKTQRIPCCRAILPLLMCGWRVMPRRFRKPGILVLLVAGAVVATSLCASAATGSSTAAHRCNDGGFTRVYRSDWSPFSSVGQCVSYAAQGGELRESFLMVTAGPPFNNLGTLVFQITIVGGGLLPSSPITLWVVGPEIEGGGFAEVPTGLIILADGTINAQPSNFIGLRCPQTTFGFSSGYVTGTTVVGQPITSNTFTAPC
jgi:hypothetical protein